MNIFSTKELVKDYGKTRALNGVSINVPQGSVYGLLGPNGSGKTTLLSIITDILKPDKGTYKMLEQPPNFELRKKMGVLLETPNFYHYLSAIDNLEITASIRGYGKEDIERVLKIVNLWERKKSPFSTYSLGMKQRLAIAACLLGNPDVLIFDEPTNGLDPVGIAEIRSLIIELNKQGKTILIASHMLDEIEKVCTHVAILKKGNLLLECELFEMKENNTTFKIAIDDNKDLKQFFNEIKNLKNINENADGSFNLVFEKNAIKASELNSFFHSKGISLSTISSFEKSLEQKFLDLTSA